MFAFEELKTIHVEITNQCQASCPMCARNFHGGQTNPLVTKQNWTLQEFKSIFTQEVCNQIIGVYFCGNFGDPILNNDLIPMVKHIRDSNPNINVAIHTNGGARNINWWEELASVMPKSHNVVFGLDGLEDTLSLYRIGVNYENVIKNAKAFINAGGIAEWCFIKFKHNEHQEQEARLRAKDLGFNTFVLKNSSRFLGEPKYRVLDKAGNVTHYIEPPSDNKMHFISKDMIDNYKKTIMPLEISCKVQKDKEIYIDAYRTVMPCCWIASAPYTQYDNDNIHPQIREQIKNQYDDLVNSLGGIDQLDAVNVGVKGVIESESWQTIWNPYWTEKKMIMCARICGVSKNISKPNDQFLEKNQLNNF